MEKASPERGFFFFPLKFSISSGVGQLRQICWGFWGGKWFGIRVCYFGVVAWGLTGTGSAASISISGAFAIARDALSYSPR